MSEQTAEQTAAARRVALVWRPRAVFRTLCGAPVVLERASVMVAGPSPDMVVMAAEDPAAHRVGLHRTPITASWWTCGGCGASPVGMPRPEAGPVPHRDGGQGATVECWTADRAMIADANDHAAVCRSVAPADWPEWGL